MATRHERVVLTLEDNFTTSAAKAAAATALINRELKDLSGQAVGTHRPLRQTSTEVDRVSTSARRGQREIDQFSGRLSVLRDIFLAIGPAVVPIGAVAIPAMTGLAAQLGAVTLAGGTVIGALQGVGDTLKAVNEAQIEPTAENLEKARVAMQNLSPAARELVRQLQEMRPAILELRDSAAAGFIPGLLEGLESMESTLPRIERLVFSLGDAAGDLTASFGEAFESDRGREFLAFLRTEMPRTLTTFGQAVGSVAAGLAELWMAFTPLNRDFGQFLLDGARGFDQWAQGLSETEGFQEFVDYLRTNGPIVADALSSIGRAVLEIVEAAAPLGGPVLEALGAVADVIANIADSDVGPSILAAAGALAILSRGQAAFGRASQTSWAQSIQAADTYRGKLTALRGPATRAGLAVAGLGAAAAGTAENFAFTNTASLALMGSLGGPWGTAVGGAVGLGLDLADSQDTAAASAAMLRDTLDEQTGALTAASKAMVTNSLESAGVLEIAEQFGISLADVTAAALGEEEALNRVNSAIDDYVQSLPAVTAGATGAAQNMQNVLDAADRLRAGIGGQNAEVEEAAASHRRLAVATKDTSDGFDTATAAAQDFRNEVNRVNRVLEGRSNLRDYEQALDDFTARAAERADILAQIADAQRELANAGDAGAEQDARRALNEADTAAERRVAEERLASILAQRDAEHQAALERIADLKEQAALLENTLNIDTQAGRDTQAALDNIASTANQVAEGLKGLDRQRFLNQARRDFIDIARDLGKTREEARRLADRLLLLDKQETNPKLEVPNIDSTTRKLLAIDDLMRGLDGRTSTMRVETVATGGGKYFKNGFATGGFTGNIDPWRIAGVVHGREVVIPEWLVRRDAAHLRSRYGFLPGMGNLPGYREGGYVDQRHYDQRRYESRSSATTGSVTIDYDRLASAVMKGRPLYGNVTLQPHNYNDFKQQMDQDRRNANLGGFGG